MTEVIAGMSMPLDGYVADGTGSVAPLYPAFEQYAASDHLRQEIAATGAVAMGRPFHRPIPSPQSVL